MKKKFDQDFCLNLWYDSLGYFRKMNSTLGSVVPLAMFFCHSCFLCTGTTLRGLMSRSVSMISLNACTKTSWWTTPTISTATWGELDMNNTQLHLFLHRLGCMARDRGQIYEASDKFKDALQIRYLKLPRPGFPVSRDFLSLRSLFLVSMSLPLQQRRPRCLEFDRKSPLGQDGMGTWWVRVTSLEWYEASIYP